MGKQNNITYLMGAGASKNALPLARDFKINSLNNPLKKFIDWLEKKPVMLTNHSNQDDLRLLEKTKELNTQLISDTEGHL